MPDAAASGDPASADRRRLDALLRVGRDETVRAADPDPATVEGAEWAAGFADTGTGVTVSVYFVRDPQARDRAAAALAGDGARVATNGGMLAVGRAPTDDVVRRRNQLLSRFAGGE